MKLNYHSRGNGKPLIVLHGLFGSLDNWQTIARALAGDFQVFTVDLRNHGGSPHSASHSYGDMAADIMAFCEDHRLLRPLILGHSMGGKVAMQFALSFPERVDRMVIADIGPGKKVGSHDTVLKALGKIDPGKLNRRAEAERMLLGDLKDKNLCLFLLKNLKRKPGGGYRWQMNLDALARNYPNIQKELSAPPYSGPVLFIRGENSDYVPDSAKPHIRKLFPQARFETVPRAGHWLHWENPEVFLFLTRAFLKPPEIDIP